MVIKYIFGKEGNEEILLDFINSVLVDENFNKIVSVIVKNPFNPKRFRIDKESHLDLKVIDENKKQYNIEIQSTPKSHFIHRILYYWSQLYASQIKEGEYYGKLRQTISINVLNFNFIKKNKALHNLAYLTLKHNPKIALTDLIFIHFIELTKLPIDKPISQLTNLEKWVYFFLNEGKEDSNMEILIKDNVAITKAHQEYQKFTQDEELRELYWMRVEGQRDIITEKEASYQEGMEKGIFEGEKIGIEKGKVEGEKVAKTETAKKMKNEGFEISLISKLTGLSLEEIEKL